MPLAAVKEHKVVLTRRSAFKKGQPVVNYKSLWAHQAGYVGERIPEGTIVPYAMVMEVLHGDSIATMVVSVLEGIEFGPYNTAHLQLLSSDSGD